MTLSSKIKEHKEDELTDVEPALVEELQLVGIRIRIARLGNKHFSCRARYDGNRDPHVTYARTPEAAVRQTAKNVRLLWPDVFRGPER